MKHSGGTSTDLPSLPFEYEWVKDAAEKNDNAWIAIRKKMPQSQIDLIRKASRDLQDALYLRKPHIIREAIKVAIVQNNDREGPSNKAINQAEEYAKKLEEHEKEREAEREREKEDLRQELEEYDLEQSLTLARSGVAQTGFGPSHPVESTRRRLYVKVLLRRSRAQELLGDKDASINELQRVLRVEPSNPEAKKRLEVLTTKPVESLPTQPSGAEEPSQNGQIPRVGTTSNPSVDTGISAGVPSKGTSRGSSDSAKPNKKFDSKDADLDLDDDDGDGTVDHASTAALLNSAAEYMRKNDYSSALQIYHYARNTCKDWETPLVELKVLSNTSLCLQRVRGRLPELVSACNEAIDRIDEIRGEGGGDISEETLLRMECACLSRRGSAYAQQRKTEESNRDAARVRELLARVGGEIEGAQK